MRCFSVFVEVTFSYREGASPDVDRPLGFAVIRYVLARDREHARERAFAFDLRKLQREDECVRDGSTQLTFMSEEVEPAPFRRLFRRPFGRAFYLEN